MHQQSIHPLFFPMYCLHVIAKGVRNERRFKEGHEASKFPISLRFFCLVVLLGLLPVLQNPYFCSDLEALLSTPRYVVFPISPLFLSFFLFLLSFVFPFQLSIILYSSIY